MKNHIYTLGWIAAILLSATSCSNAEYSFENLFPEAYHKIVYIPEEQVGDLTLYDIPEEASYTFTIRKAGSDPSEEAKVSIDSYTQSELDSLNKSYLLLPPSLYSFPKEMDIAPDAEYGKVKVVFDLEGVKKFMQQHASDAVKPNYAIGFRIGKSTATINGEKDHIIRTITVTKPSVQFTASSWNIALNDSTGSVKARLDIDNKWDFTCDIDLTRKDEDVAAYNKAHNTAYKLLPANCYTFDGQKFVFKKGTRDASIGFALTSEAGALDLQEKYLLPLRMTNSSKEGFLVTSTASYLIVSGEVGLTIDMLSSPCTQGDDGGGLAALIDHNTGTYWQSAWKSFYQNAEYGHYFEVKLAKPLKSELQIGYSTRDYAPICPIELKISVSKDGKEWTETAYLTKEKDKLCDPAGSWTSPVYELATPVQYVRYSVMRTNNGKPGVDSGASTAITGFSLWGR